MYREERVGVEPTQERRNIAFQYELTDGNFHNVSFGLPFGK